MRLAFALYGRTAGIIERSGGRMTLSYLPEYLNTPDATPLSLSMPLSDQEYSTRPVEAYLRGLLPDRADVRERWATKADVRPGDTLGLIASVGLDVSGGAIFAAEEELEDAMRRPGAIVPATEADIAAKLRRIRTDEAAWQDEDDHWSLAGAQSKFTLVRTETGWGFAAGTTPSTHIAKPGISRIPAQALSEHVSMRAFRLAGLPVADTEYLRFEDQSAIVVTRFDRRDTSGATIRLHHEDLCQAFALDPRRKYEADGGPGVQRIADLLRAATRDDSLERFVRAVIGNQIIGAPDAHAKNYGLLLAGTTATLTRLYDVATGLIPDGMGRLRYGKGAMAVGGERRFGDLERSNWERFASAVRLPAGQIVGWVEELAATLPPAFEQAAGEIAGPEADVLTERVAPVIAAVARQTIEGLTSTRRRHGRIVTPFLKTVPGSIEGFIGVVGDKVAEPLTIDEMNDVIAGGWAGERQG